MFLIRIAGVRNLHGLDAVLPHASRLPDRKGKGRAQ